MSDHADLVREALEFSAARLIMGQPGWAGNKNARAALDALVAERDEALKAVESVRETLLRECSEEHVLRGAYSEQVARVTELEAALLAWWEPQRHVGNCECRACTLTRAALAPKEGT